MASAALLSPLGFLRATRAEWTKLRTLRSTAWTLGISAAVTVGIGAYLLPSMIHGYEGPPDRGGVPAPTEEGWWYLGLHLSIIAVTILGVLVASAEYGTGTIRTTLTSVPSRLRVLTAKVTSYAAVCLVVGVAQAGAAFAVAVPVLADHSIELALTDAAAWRGILTAALAVVAAGLFGLAAGLLFRGTAAALTFALGVLWALPELALIAPTSWDGIVRLLPANAMYAMFTPFDMQRLPTWPATALFFAYIGVLLGIAGAAFARRDT